MTGLLGPTGQPISTYRKAAPPKMGPAFGDWAGRELWNVTGPGGMMLQFDLEQLTLSDYRVMRYHPQINASLAVLNFMIHQIDWHIECEDSKIEDQLTANMMDLWTRLVRAIGQSTWAGYSPCALEYENGKQYIEVSKVKDLYPEDCEVQWKEVEGWAPPGNIKPKFKIFDGIKQQGLSYPIPPENSFWYPFQMENGNYTGRKLLKPVFVPWYFSVLIHLYANRYYERFGEPVPVGRYPEDEEVDIGTGALVSGKQAIETVLQSLRNRSTVSLPSTRDPVTKEFDYMIEYLESEMRGIDFERYMNRLDEEISLGIFTPILMFKTGDVGSNNLGVQHTQCVAPETKILCADLVWREAGSLQVGQEIVAFDEDATQGGRGVNSRAYRTAVIEANMPGSKPSVTIETDIGQPITASDDHPFMTWNGRALVWKDAGDLVEGDQIAYFGDTWDTKDDFDGGWMSGIFDGEGCLSMNTSNHGGVGRGIELCVVQNDGPVLDKMKQIMTDDGHAVSVGEKVDARRLRVNGGFYAAMRCIGMYQPVRFVEKASVMWEGRGVRRNQSFELATVTSVTHIGKNPVASIQTSCGTFITEGYLSHNTFMWMLNSIIGDMAEYIERYILNRLRDFNWGPNAARPYFRWKKLGSENQETVRAIISALISKDKATVDLEELGSFLGMSVEEVKQVDPAPTNDPQQQPDMREVRDRPSSGRRGVGEPRATGRLIAARIGPQIKRAWASGKMDDLSVDFGYRRRMAQSFEAEGMSPEDSERATEYVFKRMEGVSTDLFAIADEFNSATDLTDLLDRHLDNAIDDAATAVTTS